MLTIALIRIKGPGVRNGILSSDKTLHKLLQGSRIRHCTSRYCTKCLHQWKDPVELFISKRERKREERRWNPISRHLHTGSARVRYWLSQRSLGNPAIWILFEIAQA
ncbi:hypothetical protein CEXT_675811 [Caerostris extrusa]|uniref:Uncharacterized protein n=1 Tax=Caerostris extrusa TaxID=172846 RepID=A0AAV4XCJ4_CAEEX|nr:hypothetical protein CEXT_675811 [Caerostris extrusa]